MYPTSVEVVNGTGLLFPCPACGETPLEVAVMGGKEIVVRCHHCTTSVSVGDLVGMGICTAFRMQPATAASKEISPSSAVGGEAGREA